MEKKIGILFDLDGTLLDTLEDLTDATNYALEQFSLPKRNCQEIRSFLGTGARELIRKAMPEGVTDPEVSQVLAVYKVYYEAHCRIKTRPYDGILEAMAKLQEKYPLAVVSNKPDFAVKPLCADFFPGIYCRGERTDCPRKPAPDMILRTMEDLGVESCIYVGDSEVDVLTASNAGVPCIAVLWGFRDLEVLEAAGSEYLCRDPRDLPAMVEEILTKAK